MTTTSVRYIVEDVDAAIDFYRERLGFREVMHPAPTFAMLSRGDLRLALSAPSGAGGGGQAMPDGTRPAARRWNRFMLEVGDLEATVASLRQAGVALPQRRRDGRRRQADTARGPLRQPDRAVPADPARGRAREAPRRLRRPERPRPGAAGQAKSLPLAVAAKSRPPKGGT